MLLTAASLLVPLVSTPLPVLPAQSATAKQEQVNTAKESETGHRYPVWIRSTLKKEAEAKSGDAAKEAAAAIAPKRKIMDLVGMAVREKTILAVDVYSYAFFVERNFLQKDLAPWKGKKQKSLGKDGALFTKLLEQNATKELRLRFARNVDADDVVSAFEDSLEPRLLGRRKAQKASKAEKLKDLTEFRGFFTLDKLKKGNELRFTWHPDGTLSTIVNGERKPDIESPDLCWALFDVYMGDDPISKSGKKKMVRRLELLLKGG